MHRVTSVLRRWAEGLRRIDAPSAIRGDVRVTRRSRIALWLAAFLAALCAATGFGLIPGAMYVLALAAILLGAFLPPNEVVRFTCAAITAFCGGMVAFLFSLTFELSLSGGQPIPKGSARELLAVGGAAIVALLSSILLAGRATGVARVEKEAARSLAESRHTELLEAASGASRPRTVPLAGLVVAAALVLAARFQRRREPSGRP